MSEAEAFFNGIIEAFGRLSAKTQLDDKLNEALLTDRRECGNCDHWMKKHDCPRERGVMVGGPSSGSPACDKFILKPWVSKLKQDRLASAVDFAERHHLNIRT